MNPLWIAKILGMVSGINIKKIFGYIAKHWRECLIVAFAAIIWYQNSSEVRFAFGAETIPALEKDIVVLKKDLETCAGANDKLSSAIVDNNQRIQEYAELTGVLEEELDILKGELDVERAKTNKEVEVILKDPTPQSCEKAMDYLRDAGRDIQW